MTRGHAEALLPLISTLEGFLAQPLVTATVVPSPPWLDELPELKPWTAAIPWTKAGPSERMFEYACHEGNYSVPHILSGARAVEKRLSVEKTIRK